MRFNVVIGGQLISKSDRGFSEFHWEFFAREGVVPAVLILSGPFIVYYILSHVIPVLGDEPETSE